MQKNNLVIINQHGGHFDIDVANEALKKYDRVVLMGNYKIMENSPEAAIEFDRLIKFDKSSTLRRLFSWGVCTLQVFIKLIIFYRGWHVLYYTNPPMACWVSLILSNRFSIMIYDIYPDVLRTIGIGMKNPISRLWQYINHRLYAKADSLFTLSEGMKDCLAKYGNECKIKIIPLWSGSSKFKPILKEENIFLKKYQLQDKFIVLYSGNIGYTHSVEVLIDVAKRMIEDKEIHFLIIGEGKKKIEITREIKRQDLTNITLMTYQPIEILHYSLGAADVGVVTLDENVATVSVPSKTFNLLAVGAPLLAIANDKTEMFRLLNKYKCGRCISKNDIDLMVDYINELKKNKDYKKSLSDNSILASKNYTYENAKLYFE